MTAPRDTPATDAAMVAAELGEGWSVTESGTTWRIAGPQIEPGLYYYRGAGRAALVTLARCTRAQAEELAAARATIAELEPSALHLAGLLREQGCAIHDLHDELAASKAELDRARATAGQMHADLYGMQDGALLRDLQVALASAYATIADLRAALAWCQYQRGLMGDGPETAAPELSEAEAARMLR